MAAKLFTTLNDLPKEKRGKLVELINAHLVDLLDLQSQTKVAHWNVKGPHFIALHLLFDQLAGDLAEPIDDTAERAVQLGGRATGTTREVAKATVLPEFPLSVSDGLDVVQALANSYAALAKSTRKAIEQADDLGDKDTADLFTGTSRLIDKSLWFLEAHLQK